MPYIPPQNRPGIDRCVEALAGQLADELIKNNATATISELYRREFQSIAEGLAEIETGSPAGPAGKARELAKAIVEAAKIYNQQGGWLGELNYAITRLIQAVPFAMYKRGVWKEALRYWLYAETVGALTRTAYDIHGNSSNHWIANGIAGVFEDVKDEYKRRVNTAYEAAQICKSGDCFELSPFRTQLVEFEAAGVKGWIEIMLPQGQPGDR
ncbi:MAG: hypothetical protein HZA50_14395 [Planctomycetes bacterium]|nr:hypothetical protein [Planctomycetota bacterium]